MNIKQKELYERLYKVALRGNWPSKTVTVNEILLYFQSRTLYLYKNALEFVVVVDILTTTVFKKFMNGSFIGYVSGTIIDIFNVKSVRYIFSEVIVGVTHVNYTKISIDDNLHLSVWQIIPIS